MAYINCEDVSFAYANNIAISDLNFKVGSGDYLCIVGENGSGKSTLVKGLLGLKEVYKGKLTMSDGLLSNEIGYLPQKNDAQKDFPASVNEVVLSGRLNSLGLLPFYSLKDRKEAEENMRRLNILDIRKKSFMELSGGQQQRVLLARALSATKKLILLDEPMAGLDPLVTIDLYKLIEKINQEMGMTVIMVSHDVNSAVKYASHILHLNKKQVFFGKTKDYIKSNYGAKFLGGESND